MQFFVLCEAFEDDCRDPGRSRRRARNLSCLRGSRLVVSVPSEHSRRRKGPHRPRRARHDLFERHPQRGGKLGLLRERGLQRRHLLWRVRKPRGRPLEHFDRVPPHRERPVCRVHRSQQPHHQLYLLWQQQQRRQRQRRQQHEQLSRPGISDVIRGQRSVRLVDRSERDRHTRRRSSGLQHSLRGARRMHRGIVLLQPRGGLQGGRRVSSRHRDRPQRCLPPAEQPDLHADPAGSALRDLEARPRWLHPSVGRHRDRIPERPVAPFFRRERSHAVPFRRKLPRGFFGGPGDLVELGRLCLECW